MPHEYFDQTGVILSWVDYITNMNWYQKLHEYLRTAMVVILQERAEFSFQILRIPKEDAVKVFPPNCFQMIISNSPGAG